MSTIKPPEPKLTLEERDEIVRLWLAGYTVTELQRKFHICETTVRRYIKPYPHRNWNVGDKVMIMHYGHPTEVTILKFVRRLGHDDVITDQGNFEYCLMAVLHEAAKKERKCK